MDLRSYAKKYYEKWRVSPIPIVYDSNDNMVPLIKWGDIFDKESPVLIDKEEVWRKASGIAILPHGNHVAIDFDLPSYMSKDKYAEIMTDYFVVVRTRRGFHVHFEVDQPVGRIEIRIYDEHAGEGGGSLFKHVWTVPPTMRSGFQYRFLKHDDVPELPRYSWEEAKTIIEVELLCEIIETLGSHLKGSNMQLGVESIAGVEALTADQLKILLFLIFHDMKCKGLRDLMYEWVKLGRVNMKKFGWGNRTSRFYFLHTIASVLALLGCSEAKATEVLESYWDLDGKPSDSHSSALWTVYRWRVDLFRRLYVLRRGECPFCSLRGYSNCQKNPVMRFYYYQQSRGREKLAEIVKKLKSM
uniref:DNA primase/polymerase bifunctional N-terminal domain-containing protein n=1 Tax=Ignisphaera aggregans TaxID=334771 RepID=A0A7J2TC75_9CREN